MIPVWAGFRSDFEKGLTRGRLDVAYDVLVVDIARLETVGLVAGIANLVEFVLMKLNRVVAA